MEDDQEDPPQNKVRDSGNLPVNPDPVAKTMSQVNMISTQYKNENYEITTLLRQIFQEQDWGDPVYKGLVGTAKNLWHANIPKDKLKDYVENEKITTNCIFLSVPKMTSKIFCQTLSQAKGPDVNLQKQQKLLSMASLKLVKILDNLMVIKECKNLDSVRITSMKDHATEALVILGCYFRPYQWVNHTKN